MSDLYRQILFFGGAFVITATGASAQTTVFSRDRFWLVGSTSSSGMRNELALAMNDREIRQHTSPLGKPCLVPAAMSRPLRLSINTFEHVIEAKNSCSVIIKVHICYYQSDHCVLLSTPSYGKAEVILGVASAVKDFRYQYREDF